MKRANLLGAHRSFGVLAVGSRTVSVCRAGRGAHLELVVLTVGLPSLRNQAVSSHLFIKMNTINHAQIMKHIQTRAERAKYDEACAEKVETLPITRPYPRR